MAIYDRSNIDYSGMIRDMINARTAKAKIAADNIRRQGELWGNFAKDMGAMGARTLDAYQAYQESPEARLKALEQELQEAQNEQKYNEQVAQRRAFDEFVNNSAARKAYMDRAAASMDGYRPNMAGYGVYMDAPQNEYMKVIEDEYRRRV